VLKVPVIIRHPRPDESLTPLWPSLEKYGWNLDGIWVAEHEGAIVGGVIVWDAGHDIVRVDNLHVIEDYRTRGVAYVLLDAVVKTLHDKGRRVILSTTQDIRMAYWAQKKGAAVGVAAHLIWWEIA